MAVFVAALSTWAGYPFTMAEAKSPFRQVKPGSGAAQIRKPKRCNRVRFPKFATFPLKATISQPTAQSLPLPAQYLSG
jgi:hypothetical protein